MVEILGGVTVRCTPVPGDGLLVFTGLPGRSSVLQQRDRPTRPASAAEQPAEPFCRLSWASAQPLGLGCLSYLRVVDSPTG
jgi:hypothetical protein